MRLSAFVRLLGCALTEEGRGFSSAEVTDSEAPVGATASCWCWCWCWCSWASLALRFRGKGRRVTGKGQGGAGPWLAVSAWVGRSCSSATAGEQQLMAARPRTPRWRSPHAALSRRLSGRGPRSAAAHRAGAWELVRPAVVGSGACGTAWPAADSAGGVHGIDARLAQALQEEPRRCSTNTIDHHHLHDEAEKAYACVDGRGAAEAGVAEGRRLGGVGPCHGFVLVLVLVLVLVCMFGASLSGAEAMASGERAGWCWVSARGRGLPAERPLRPTHAHPPERRCQRRQPLAAARRSAWRSTPSLGGGRPFRSG